MYTNSGGYPREADVRRLLRTTSTRKSSIPSRNASGSSGHPHSWRGNRGSHQLMSLGLIHAQSLLLLIDEHMRNSPLPKWDFYEGMMALVRDTHWQALVAAALLEEKMEWMSCSIRWCCSGIHCHSSSHKHRRSQSLGHWREDSQAMSHHGEPEGVLTAEGPQATSHHRGTARGQAQSSSPFWQQRCVTFAEGRPPCHPRMAWKWMPGLMKPTGCPHQPGRMRGC